MLGWGACLQVTTALLREAQSMEGVIICGEEDGGFGVFFSHRQDESSPNVINFPRWWHRMVWK